MRPPWRDSDRPGLRPLRQSATAKATLNFIICGLVTASTLSEAWAQTFVGTNQPGSGSGFSFVVGTGATNLSLVITNSSTAFSYLFLKAGSGAGPTDFDFVSRLDKTNNSVNLEPPEFQASADYSLWVQTPTNSLAHAFTVGMTTNRADARQSSMPILKPLAFSVTGTLSPGAANFFQIDVPTNLPGLRLVLAAKSGNPGLYLQRGSLPSVTTYLKRSTAVRLTTETVYLDNTQASNATYFASVIVPGTDVGNVTYTLSAEDGPVITTLGWDPGSSAAPMTGFTNQSASGGDYFFQITTLSTDSGAWRTRLDVQNGEADLYLRPGALPASAAYQCASTQAGSDGLVLVQNAPSTPNSFQPGQVWYAMVTATPGAKWSVYSGNLFARSLPSPSTDRSGGTNDVIAPEGMNFYRLTIDANTIAWRLDLSGLTNSLFVHQGNTAFSNSPTYYDWKQPGQALLTTPYLKSGAGYFVTVLGAPGQAFTMESQQQAILELPFDSSTNVIATDYGYVTFHVQVPPQQIGWQLDLAANSGDPGLAVRQSAVANEFVNTAFAETPNAPSATLTLVPPTLTDGSYYLTVYGTLPFSASLTNSRPLITYVDYAFMVTNDMPGRQGWRFYCAKDISQQLNSLGWQLDLNNFSPGTEIAARRNALPGRLGYRTNYTQGAFASGTTWIDASSKNGTLQLPRLPADVWYIGINNTNQPLGAFLLTGRQIPWLELPLAAQASANQVTEQPAGLFQYFHIDVPTNAMGLELALSGVTSGDPRLVVGRDQLPVSLNTWLVNSNAWAPNTSTNWPSGAQAAFNTDWTGFTIDASGSNEQGHFFFASRGNPLEPGSYYVGVINGPSSTNHLDYQLLVRGVFADVSIADVPVNGNGTGSGLAPSQVAWQRVVVPANTPSWKVRLDFDSGDGFFVFRNGGLPNYGASLSWPTNLTGCLVRKPGAEHLLMLPSAPETNVPPGTYFFGVVGEGQGAFGGRAGSNTSAFTLTSEGPLVLTNLGTVDPSGTTTLTAQASQDRGEVVGYQFEVLSNTPVLEVRLTNVIASLWMVMRTAGPLPQTHDVSYGVLGGSPATWSDDNLIRVPTPAAGLYTLLVQAMSSGGQYTNTSYILQVSTQQAIPISSDDGNMQVTNQSSDSWSYFRVTVPPDAMGWDLRLTDISQGDPRLVIISGTNYPSKLNTITASEGSWNPYTSTNWPTGWQIAPDTDWTGYRASASGSNQAGTVFVAAMGNPLIPGDYVIGVTSGTQNTTTNPMSFTLISRWVGTNYTIGIAPLAYGGGRIVGTSLPAREASYYRVDVPSNSPSWLVNLSLNRGEGLLLIRKEGLPTFGASVATSVTNISGCKLQKLGDEHFLLLPVQPAVTIPAGSYYLAVVSEGISPSAPRIGSNACDYALQSVGTLPVQDLGFIDPVYYFETNILQPGGSACAFEFNVASNAGPIVVRLDSRVNNPAMTLRAGTLLPSTVENYGRQGGWAPDLSNPSYIRVDNPGGDYRLLVQAENVSGLYPDASYKLRLYRLGYYTIPLEFDAGSASFSTHSSGEWLFFSVVVPTNALGWDLRLTNITSGNPRLVVCRSGYPYDLSSRLVSGGGWNWGSSASWPAGAQAAPGIDWTGYQYETNTASPGGITLLDTTGTIFAAGVGSPIEPGSYIVGVSSAPGSASPMAYSIVSHGIGAGFSIPVTSIGTGQAFATFTNLAPRQAGYYSVVVPTNTPLWKVRLSPSAGDAFMAIRKDALPNITAASGALASSVAGGHKFQKSGVENALLGRPSGQTNVPAGTYFIAVVGEGAAASSAKSIIGNGTTDFTLQSALPSMITDLGQASGSDLVTSNQLEGGETAVYQFTLPAGAVSLSVGLENVSGSPLLRLRSDQNPPLDVSAYGQDGGYRGNWEATTSSILLSNPQAGIYSLSVLANNGATSWPTLEYNLRVHAVFPGPTVAFDGGTAQVTNQGVGWQVFQITVPADAIGWDLRLINVTSGSPQLVVRRDQFPASLGSSGVAFNSTTWPSGAQLAAGADWTQLNEPDGTSSTGRVFEVGMGNPLQPGTYYIGISNVDMTKPASYTVLSRGIGSGYMIPVEDLSFSGGSSSRLLAARDAAWFRIQVPPNAPSWKVALNFDTGDGLLLVQRGVLPSIGATSANSLSQMSGGKKMQLPGDEFLLDLATTSGGSLPAGVYYLGVVSVGLNPNNVLGRIGTGDASFTLFSDGILPAFPLGVVGLPALVGQASLHGGECSTWGFIVPPGIPALEVSFDLPATTGKPWLTMAYGTNPPALASGYGTEGGVPAQWQCTLTNVITVANAPTGAVSLTVQAAGSGTNFPGSDLQFSVRSLPVPELSFDPQLNTNGILNTAEGVLQDQHKAYWRVQVPYTINGQPVVGWKLSLSALYGTPEMRVRKGALPDNAGSGTSTNFLRQAILVPDYLSPGTWYVEVSATGLTDYTLTSESLSLTRAAWLMPAQGEPVSTPGLASIGPLFGDSGIDTNGIAVAGDQGTDLEQDSSHYYALIVPPGNGGLLRTELDAISGNPTLYLRTNAPPTLSHNASGGGGAIFNRVLTDLGTKYGNWVALDGRSEHYLSPGLWYLAVHAAWGGSVRYRLQVSTGNMTNLAFKGGNVTDQTLAAGDWSYYRVQVPLDMPDSWIISFSKQKGNVALYVRDTIPPGLGLSASDFVDWSRDQKNLGPYPSWTNAGSYTLTVPSVRPGSVYFLGVRCVSDASFSISSSPGVHPIVLDGLIPFGGGSISAQAFPGTVLRYRIDVPPDGQVWSQSTTNSSSVRFYLEQGTLPTLTTSDHWFSTAANSTYSAILTNSSWPWLPGFSYFLAVTNTSGSPQPFLFVMNGIPSNSNSFPVQIIAPSIAADGRNFMFSVNAAAGQNYRILVSSNLAAGSWVELTNIFQTSPTQALIIPIDANQPKQFYRISSP